MKKNIWKYISGPLITLSVIAGLELLSKYILRIPSPAMIYITAVIYSTYMGGLASGFISGAITLLYAAYFFSIPGMFLHYTPENLMRIIIILITTPAIVLMVGVLKRRSQKAIEEASIRAIRHDKMTSQVRALHTAGNALVSNMKLEAILKALVKAANEILDAKYTVLCIINSEGEILQFISEGLSDSKVAEMMMRSNGPGFMSLIRAEEPVRIQNGDRISGLAVLPESLPAVNSFLCVPVIVRGNKLGLLFTADRMDGHIFTRDDEEMLVTLANDAAMAVDNAMLSDQIKQLAISDPLTGLFTLRHFFNLAGIEFEKTKRAGRSLSVIMIDLDHLKQVNDKFGHDAGDRILKAVSKRCQKCLRKTDIMGRYGGEEFAIVLPDTDMLSAHHAADKLRQCIARDPVDIGHGMALPVTISLGIASYFNECANINEIINVADRAVQKAKNDGRNRVAIIG